MSRPHPPRPRSEPAAPPRTLHLSQERLQRILAAGALDFQAELRRDTAQRALDRDFLERKKETP